MRVAREPERPCRFHRHVRLGNRKTNSPEPPAARPGRWEQTGRKGGIAKRSGYRNRSGDASIGGKGETVEVSQPRL
jgi:hypothetical protein